MPKQPMMLGDKVSFNINEDVYVQLTQHGLAILKDAASAEVQRMDTHNYGLDFYARVMSNFTQYPGMWYKNQMWCFMRIFGENFSNGAWQAIAGNKLYFSPDDVEKVAAEYEGEVVADVKQLGK